MIRTLVYGSRVSRDLIALHNDDMICVDYIARQSWISATSTPIESGVVGGTVLDSKFQNQMLVGDFASSAVSSLTEAMTECDLILIDIIDDRFGVYPLGNGYITPTAEFATSGIRPSLELGHHIPFGSDEHFDLWKKSADKIRSALDEVIERVVVLSTEFTERSADDTVVPQALGSSANLWNEKYKRYYAHVNSLGFKVVELPSKLAVSTPHHRWGIAPFHYMEASYEWLYSRIKSM